MNLLGNYLAFLTGPLAMLPEAIEQRREVFELLLEGGLPTRPRADVGPESRQVGGTRLIPIVGHISPRPTIAGLFFGETSLDWLGNEITQAARDPEVRTILLEVDSPGGSVLGLEEVAQQIIAAREEKPVGAVVTGEAASAAYFLASQANEVVAGPSAVVGSIGTILVHGERSKADERAGLKYTIIHSGKHKADGSSHAPLDEQGRATLEELVGSYYEQFIRAVARGRRVDASRVREGYGQGKLLIAEKAKAAGMIDRIATLQEALRQLS